MGDRFMSGQSTVKYSPKAESAIVNGYEEFMKKYADGQQEYEQFKGEVAKWQDETRQNYWELSNEFKHLRDCQRENMYRTNLMLEHLWNMNNVLAVLLCTPFMRFLNWIFRWYYMTLEEQEDVCSFEDRYYIQIHMVLPQDVNYGSVKQLFKTFREDLKEFKTKWKVKHPWKELRKSF